MQRNSQAVSRRVAIPIPGGGVVRDRGHGQGPGPVRKPQKHDRLSKTLRKRRTGTRDTWSLEQILEQLGEDLSQPEEFQ
jgi:hypothetical protein